MSATPIETLRNAAVTNCRIVACNGRPARWATKVTLPDGRCIRFSDRLGRREALRQAAHHLRREQA